MPEHISEDLDQVILFKKKKKPGMVWEGREFFTVVS